MVIFCFNGLNVSMCIWWFENNFGFIRLGLYGRNINCLKVKYGFLYCFCN